MKDPRRTRNTPIELPSIETTDLLLGGLLIAASVVLSVFLARANMSQALLLEILIGLTGALFGLTFTLLFRAIKETNDLKEAQGVASNLHQSMHRERLIKLIDLAIRCDFRPSPFMHSRTGEVLERAAKDLKSLSNGYFICSIVNETRFVREALDDHKYSRVRAVAARGKEFWRNTSNDPYFDAYKRRAGKGKDKAEVTRIFLISDEEEREYAARIAGDHDKVGIETYSVDRKNLPQDLTDGMVIFDERLLHRSASLVEGNPAHDVVFTDSKEEIADAVRRFNEVLAIAQERGGRLGQGRSS